MMIGMGKSLYWIGIAGLVGMLALGGCSKKNVAATTSGTEAAPLQGMSKNPKEEGVQPPPMTMAKADQSEIDARRAREAAQKQLADIYFEFDKWVLTAEGKKNLTQSAEALKQVSTLKLLIEGHCDERGTREYNLVLGEKRAKETKRFLLSLGIQNKMVVTSYGKERPVCTEHDESCYWKNRRAHLVLETSNGK
jgi:peptidoglycan-associated lipoprotein